MTVEIIRGDILERSPAVFLRQVTGLDGEYVQQSDILSVTYDVWIVPMTRKRYTEVFGEIPLNDGAIISPSDATSPANVVHNRILSVSDVIFDTLQTDNRWTQDDNGYNFAAELGPQDFPEIDLEDYPTPAWQEVWFTLTPVIGNPFQLGYIVKKWFNLTGRFTGSGSGSGA